MKTIDIYDPPMCCSTGVCGPAIDPVLPRFVADLHWLSKQGVKVNRYNLAQEPLAFAANHNVKAVLVEEGNECLPLILVDGEIVTKGIYPDRRGLAELLGLGEAQDGLALAVIQGAS